MCLPSMMQGALCPFTPHVRFIREPQHLDFPPGRLPQPFPPHFPQDDAQHTFLLEIPP